MINASTTSYRPFRRLESPFRTIVLPASDLSFASACRLEDYSRKRDYALSLPHLYAVKDQQSLDAL
jgi:hypothetical protein